jgi:hypothetical protein
MMKRNSLKTFAAVALLALTGPLHAQEVTVDAKIDSLELLIGEQAKVTLEVSLDANRTFQLPLLKDTLVTGVEIVDVAKPDTQLLNAGKRMLVTQEYTVTSFDSALYYLPPFNVKVGDKVFSSKALALKVYSVPVDTLHPEQFFGPKEIHAVPLTWDDLKGLVGLIVLLLALGGLTYYLSSRYRNDKPIIRRIKVEPKLLPHEQALKDIEQIKADRTLQANDPKAYYTALTDALRKYMAERFGFDAMEMTSTEIIESLQHSDSQSISELKDLFTTADLVKFAKHAPLMNENDMNLMNAMDFINRTKVEPDPNAKPEPTEITVEEKRSRRAKMALAGGIGVVAVACMAVIYFIVREVMALWF